MKGLRKFWHYGKEFSSIEHRSKGDGSFLIYTLTAIKRRGEFEIRKTFTNNSIDSISKHLKKNQHLFLNITGSQVLIKSTGSSGNDSKIIGSAFPNIDINEFYYQILRTSSKSFVALCRKEYIDETLNLYKGTNLEIIGFSLGFSTIQHVLDFFKEQIIQLASYSLNTNDKEIISFEKNEKILIPIDHLIDDTLVNSNYLLALSGLFCYERLPENLSSNFAAKNSLFKKNQHQKVFFRKGLWVGCSFLIISLLINFLFFTNYYSEYQQLSEAYQVELIQKQVRDEKMKTLLEKEKVVYKILNNSKSKSTFFLNRIIVSKPVSIVLSEFTFQPLKGQIKENESINIIQNRILISGESENDKDFSHWLKSLEETGWIEKVEVADYTYKTNGRTDFRIFLTISQNEPPK